VSATSDAAITATPSAMDRALDGGDGIVRLGAVDILLASLGDVVLES
jgi:hypothetical protein